MAEIWKNTKRPNNTIRRIMNNKDKSITLRLPANILQWLYEQSKLQDKTVSQVIRDTILEKVNK